MMHRDRSGLAEARDCARQVETASLRVDRAAESPVAPVMVVDGALMAAGYHHHRSVLAVTIVEHDADGGEVVIGVRVERPVLVPLDRCTIPGRLHVELARVE